MTLAALSAKSANQFFLFTSYVNWFRFFCKMYNKVLVRADDLSSPMTAISAKSCLNLLALCPRHIGEAGRFFFYSQKKIAANNFEPPWFFLGWLCWSMCNDDDRDRVLWERRDFCKEQLSDWATASNLGGVIYMILDPCFFQIDLNFCKEQPSDWPTTSNLGGVKWTPVFFQSGLKFFKFEVPTGRSNQHGPGITHLYLLALQIQNIETTLE